MKKYMEPVLEVQVFAVEDVIATSGDGNIPGDSTVGGSGSTQW